MAIQTRKLFVAAAGRSGTKYIAKVWRRAGLDVGHEYVANHGTSSCYFVSNKIRYPVNNGQAPKGRCVHQGERRADFEFEHVWHQVRHPIDTIDSLRWIIFFWRDCLSAHGVPDSRNPLVKSVRYWWLWNTMCEEQSSYRYRVESIDVEFASMCKRLGLSGVSAVPDVSRDVNHAFRYAGKFAMSAVDGDGKKQPVPYRERKRIIDTAPKVTWSDLFEADPDYAERVRSMARRYGYDVDSA